MLSRVSQLHAPVNKNKQVSDTCCSTVLACMHAHVYACLGEILSDSYCLSVEVTYTESYLYVCAAGLVCLVSVPMSMSPCP